MYIVIQYKIYMCVSINSNSDVHIWHKTVVVSLSQMEAVGLIELSLKFLSGRLY